MLEVPVTDRVRPDMSLRSPSIEPKRSGAVSLRASAKQSPFVKAAGIVAGAALAVVGAEKVAQAQTLTPLGDPVNRIENIDNPIQGQASADLVPGVSGDRVRLQFALGRKMGQSTPSMDPLNSYVAVEFKARRNSDGSLTLTQMGDAVDTTRVGYVGLGTDYVRPDGRTTQVRWPSTDPNTGQVNGDLGVDSQPRWQGPMCPGVHYLARGTQPNELLVVASFNSPLGPGLNGTTNVWRIPDVRNISDFCAYIQAQIAAAEAAANGQNLFQAGLLIPRESTAANEETVGIDETMEFVSRLKTTGPGVSTYLYGRDSTTGALTHLQRNANGTWAAEVSSGNAEPSLDGTIPYAVHKMSMDGHTYHLFVVEGGDQTTSILKAFALEETGTNLFNEVPLTMSQSPTPADDDGDGIPNSDDKCPYDSNPSMVDENMDGIPDACQVNSCLKQPGIDQPSSSDETTECVSELGYAYARKFVADGSKIHSNEPIVLGSSGEIAVQPGQEVRYIHSKDARVDCSSQSAQVCLSRRIKFPDGNSVHFKLNETDKPDGAPGTATFSQIPLDDPFAEPVVVTFPNPTTNWQNYDPGIGAYLASEGSDVTVRAGNENLPVPTCPPDCPVDGGTPSIDGGSNPTDAGQNPQDAGYPADGGTAIIDAGETPDAQPNPEDAGSNAEDGGQNPADANYPADSGETPDASGAPDASISTDAGQNPQDGGPIDVPDASTPTTDGGEAPDGSVEQPDAGETPDAQPNPEDAGQNTPDGGIPTEDGGLAVDGGPDFDAGTETPDANNIPDSGLSLDSGTNLADGGANTPDASQQTTDGGKKPEEPDEPGCVCGSTTPASLMSNTALLALAALGFRRRKKRSN